MSQLNKKVLFIHPYPYNTAGGQRFRYEQYINLLKENNVQVKFQSFLSDRAWKILYSPGYKLEKSINVALGFAKRFGLLFLLYKYDFIFIYREATPIGPPIFEFLIAKILNKKIIYDFDDAIWLQPTSTENKLVSKLKWHSKVKSICKWSYKVSAGNDYLAGFAKNHNKYVITNPTTIDPSYHKPSQKAKTGPVVIGWTGTHSTTKYLKLIEEPLNKIQKSFDVEYVFICDKAPLLNVNFRFIKWNEKTEIEDLQKIDIGLMPLSDSVWEQGKCGFKALQYMAIGIPALVSPVGVNKTIIDHEVNGFHCTTEDDWEENLKKLLQDKSSRIRLGEAARKKVILQYSMESNSNNFLQLFS